MEQNGWEGKSLENLRGSSAVSGPIRAVHRIASYQDGYALLQFHAIANSLFNRESFVPSEFRGLLCFFFPQLYKRSFWIASNQ